MQKWEELMWKYQKPLPSAQPGEKWVPMEKIFEVEIIRGPTRRFAQFHNPAEPQDSISSIKDGSMAIPCSLAAVFLWSGASRLISLAPSDVLIIALYFVMVLGIGIYLRRYANTSNDFFMAGREMTAWVAGLSFLSANLGAIELMGWAASDLRVRHSGRALLLDRRLPVHGLPRAGDDAVLLHLQDALGSRLSATALRRIDPRA